MPVLLKQPVPRQWPGETVAVVASGPSLTQSDVDQLRGNARVIVVNNSYEMAPWADLLYACDERWWKYNPAYQTFAGEKWTQHDSAALAFGLRHVMSINRKGLSADPNYIHQGHNSGYQAINLATLFGARRVLLLGYDCQPTNGKAHWHGSHRQTNNPGEINFRVWRKAFATIPASAEALGVEIINCSRETALTCFPRRPLEDALCNGMQSPVAQAG